MKYDPLELRRQWRSFKANSHGVTGGTLISLAREHGYANAHDHNCKFSVPIHPESEVPQNSTTAGRAIGYTYIDADGQIYGKKIRYEPKAFAWDKDKKAGRCPPYGLPRLLEHADEPVFVVEGEKDADRLNKEGLVAISIEQGHETHAATFLEGRTVFILPDNDDTGQRRAQKVLNAIKNVADWRGS